MVVVFVSVGENLCSLLLPFIYVNYFKLQFNLRVYKNAYRCKYKTVKKRLWIFALSVISEPCAKKVFFPVRKSNFNFVKVHYCALLDSPKQCLCDDQQDSRYFTAGKFQLFVNTQTSKLSTLTQLFRCFWSLQLKIMCNRTRQVNRTEVCTKLVNIT